MLCFLERQATPRRTLAVLVLLLLTMGLVNATTLPFTGPWLGRLTGGMGLLDLRFFYRGDEARAVIAAYGPAGRHACLAFYGTWDLAIPLLGMAFTALALATTWGLGGARKRLLLLPLAAMALDFLENLSIAGMLLRFPQDPGILANVAGPITLLKWTCYATSAAVLAAGVGYRLWPRNGSRAISSAGR